ncbi:6317_t:CDS:2 [Acaulospora morrowiae]|uniref:6317_t:CDS:1 n=1 Tax=Acaulospora morrowiae TaxID=94023 RepID=A0A9N8ZG01_9GLOM|nr:6317_t:CDS:2 [Acaulospora morrowiae]
MFTGQERCCTKHPHNLSTSKNPSVTIMENSFDSFDSGLTYLLTIVIYGDDLTTLSENPPLLCIIQSKISQLFFYPLQIYPAVLSVYLWFATIKLNIQIEQISFWWLTGFIWGLAILRSVVSWVIESNDHHKSGVTTTKFFCAQVDSEGVWLIYLIPMIILTVLSIIIAVHSGIILWDRWKLFSNRQNRRTAIKLGQSLRLAICGYSYVIALLISLLPSLIRKFQSDMPTSAGWSISDFSSSFIGITIFLIFGTKKTAAVFLPFYYAPPDDDSRYRQTMKTGYPESNPNTYQLEAFNTVLRYPSQGLEQQKVTDFSTIAFFPRSQPERELTNELNVAITMPDSPFSRSSFRTVSSQKTILDVLPSPV